ncbi:MAG TPA: class I SAM-dependent methyltransferase [Candidatus Acidoferrales bacterium]|nr:class I SAM-dependent methyltransferase [Candidatus Acidoferrales bacterium]
MASLAESADLEEARIRAAYARRRLARDRRYSWFTSGHLFTVQHLERRVLACLRAHGFADLQTRSILEVGCGNGHWLREFAKWGASPENLHGIELLEDRVAEARALCPAPFTIRQGNAAALPIADGAMDIVLQATMMTSISSASVRRQVAAEMLRVLKSDGLILWYDFYRDNPRNPDVRAVKREEIASLFPGCTIALERVTLAPPLARSLAPYSWIGCELLAKIPWLCTHYLGAIRKSPRAR